MEGTGQTARGSDAGASRGSTPVLRRLLFAQETGLLIVIVLFAAWLTISGGTKQRIEQQPLPADAVITQSADGFSVTRDGTLLHEYRAAEGWSIRDLPDSKAAFRRVEVNKFLDLNNLVLLAKDASFFAIIAVGMTGIIVMGGIDLSVGSIYALSAIVGALMLRSINAGAPPGSGGAAWWLAIPAGLGVCCAVGGLCGLANGAMIVGLRVHPFIITLGTMAVLRGVVFLVTRANTISEFPESFTGGFIKATIAGVEPVPVFLMAIVVALGAIVLGHTVLGRRTYAIGGNETAATYAGVPVGRVKLVVYTLSGVLAGLSSAVYLGYYGAASPDAGQGYELPVIAATVIGGASLSGGRGSALGALLGAILIQLISNAMIILEIDTSYTQVVMGAAIIVAVVLDQAKARLVHRRG